jgi:transposase-like protein
MNLIDVVQQFKTDDDCLDYLEALRWPDGKTCAYCDSPKVMRIERKSATATRRKADGTERTHKVRTRLYECAECGKQFTPTLGTIFHDSHMPLVKWFMALALLVDAKKGMSAKQLQNHLGVAYRTAWYMAHRIRKAMDQDETEFPKLSGVVEVDETYLGGRTVRPYGGGRKKGNKDIVIGLRERGGRLRLMHADDVKAGTLQQIIEAFVDKDVEMIVTDDFRSYPLALKKFEGKHRSINHSAGHYVTGDSGEIHTNTIESAFSLLKRGIIGNYHFVSIKHLHRYLAEFEHRFNERKNPERFDLTLRRMLTSEPIQYKELTASA